MNGWDREGGEVDDHLNCPLALGDPGEFLQQLHVKCTQAGAGPWRRESEQSLDRQAAHSEPRVLRSQSLFFSGSQQAT